VVGRGANTRRQ